MTQLIAHRGSHEYAPENTLEAFEAAAEHGADMVELDVRRTADGQLAIFHDPEAARRPLSRLTLEELQARTGVDVPVLDEVVDWAEGSGVGLDVELKEDGYVDAVARSLRGFSGRLIITSFLDPVVGQLADLAPDSERGLLLSLTARDAVRRVRACRADAAVIEMRLLSEAGLADLSAAGLRAYLWDFWPDRAADRAWLADPRVSGVITDDLPGTAAALIR